MAASNSRVLISQFRKLGTSIPTCRSSSTSIYTHGSSQAPTSIPTSRSSCIPTRTLFTFYPNGEQKCVERLSKVAPVEICYKGGWTPDRVDKLIAGSPQAVCCFYPYFAEDDQQHTPAFIQMLLKRFPDVKPFHFFLYDHSWAHEDDRYVDEAVVALNILSLPTFYFYKNGEKVGEVVGNSILRFKEVLEEHYKFPDERKAMKM